MTEQTTAAELSAKIIERLRLVLHYDEGVQDICCWGPAELEVQKILDESCRASRCAIEALQRELDDFLAGE